ncbi:uncharacterized protein EI90DRAFT_3062791 [Cantharellus anzutake]|uniref:uncharacterized protein n=1 Tax=Cantharellus anzutake TaxID=1750568 RepID=UPI0019072555|nr:uncharacterized protein EI90DRAFT_3062791 [Cantharellus anzutake]KAF8329484.1 hypothetical protein EI90DRAFT_3062791 [Cantharellus anzutake]
MSTVAPVPSSIGNITSRRTKSSLKPSGTLPTGNGSPSPETLKLHSSPKLKKRSPQKTSFKRFKRHLFWPFIFALGYLAIVCPSKPDSNICIRSSVYWDSVKTHSTPAIQYVISHPSVEPYVQKLEPHCDRITRFFAPAFNQFRGVLGPIVVKIEYFFNTKVGPHIQPYIRKAQLQFDARVRPLYLKYAEPRISRWRHFVTKASPYFERTRFALQQSWYRAQPYIRKVQFYLIKAWNAVRPHLSVLLEKLNGIPLWAKQRFGPTVYQVYKTYVEPQIRKISAKIDELGSRGGNTTPSSITSPVPTVSSTGPAAVVETKTSTPDMILETVQPPTNSVEDVFFDPTDFIANSIAETPSPIPTSAEGTEDMTSSPFETLSPVYPAQVSPAHTEPEVKPEPEIDDIIDDIFRADSPEPTPREEPPSEETATVEDAQRLSLEEIHEKRKKIEARHTEWEAKVDQAGKVGIENLIGSITSIRHKAVNSLSSAEEGTIGVQIAVFKAEGSKAIKGVGAYANKLMNGHYHGAEKIGLFDAVVRKVEKRYGEGAKRLSDAIAEWWAEVRNEAQGEVKKEGGKVEDVAGDAQADLGMDYAWLEDVTTHDWTRYHDLKRYAKEYENQYQAILDGEHPQSPVDPLPDVLQKLRDELLEIVSVFEKALVKARDDGFGMFVSGAPKDTEPTSSPNDQASSESSPYEYVTEQV